jgi:hypothetical protein
MEHKSMTRIEQIQTRPDQIIDAGDERVVRAMEMVELNPQMTQQIICNQTPTKLELVGGRITYNAYLALNKKYARLGVQGPQPTTTIQILSPIEAVEVEAEIDGKSLTPIETAKLIHLMSRMGFTEMKIAKIFGNTQPWVNYMLRVVELPQHIQSLVQQNVLRVSVALLFAELPQEVQQKLLHVAQTTGRKITNTVVKAAIQTKGGVASRVKMMVA